MATQPLPTYDSLSNVAVVPIIRRRLASRRPLASPAAAGLARKDQSKSVQRQRMLVEMLPLVKRVAFKVREHLPSHVDFDDLVGSGVLGLVDAVSKFNAQKQVKLESYARHRVRGGILDGLRSADPVSRDLRRKSKGIQKIYRTLEAKLGRPVLDEEIAAAMNLSLAEWHSTLNEIQTAGFDIGSRALSAGPTVKRPSAEPAMLAGDDADPFDLCYRGEQRQILGRALSHLRERERQIITLYYQQDLTMKQIAERLNVDESRVSQIHSAALVRLKTSVNAILNPRQTPKASAPAPLSMAAGAGW